MPSLKHVKRRIQSVRSTKQITKAMDLVAAAKLQKMKTHLDDARLLAENASRVVNEAKSDPAAAASIFSGQKRKVKASAYVVMTGERGLCGSYNTNIIQAAINHMEQNAKNEKIIALGSRGHSFMKRKDKDIMLSLPGVIETAFYEDAEQLGRYLTARYLSGDIDEVFVAYTHFESTFSHKPRVEMLLPVQAAADNAPYTGTMKFEPNPADFLDAAVPFYISMAVYGAMVESVACEQAARMMSMNGASKNADDIIDTLTLTYNRSRQSMITQEINEIVGGANALR